MKTISPQVLLEIMGVFRRIDRDDKGKLLSIRSIHINIIYAGSILYQDLVIALRTLTLPPTIRSILQIKI